MAKRADGVDWWRGAVIYQIYPRSFADSNGDGVGDLRGVAERLDHVASLGVDGIWLSPFFTSPMKDFGYDVSDYRDVDPIFGTLADFDALVARAHGLGLKIVIDQVWSHTSDRHPWFIESVSSASGAKGDWYVWAEAKPDGSPPNNWLARFGGSSWQWRPERRRYYFHNFLIEQPDLNYWNGAVRDAILEVGRFWLDRGVDGFRLDAIDCIVHDRGLRDNPPAGLTQAPAMPIAYQRLVHSQTQPEALDFIRRVRAMVDEYEDRMTVGEVVGEPLLEVQQRYCAPPDHLHTAYSFFLLNARKATPELFSQATSAWSGGAAWPSWSLGNHDVARFPTRLARSGERREAHAQLAALMFLRGTVFLYQGEELGLPQAQVPFEALRDPFAINSFTGESGRDGARTPMPWTPDGPAAGFSSRAETWLPIDPAHRPLAVSAQEEDAGSTLHFVRALVALRRRHPALRVGEARLASAPQGVFAIERSAGDETLLCAVNLSAESVEFASEGHLLAGAEFLGGEVGEAGRIRLPPFAAAVLRASP